MMNVYDFDGTIYDGDSTLDFYKFCLKKHPNIIFLLPVQLGSFFLYKLNLIDKTRFKELFFCFLKKLKSVDDDVILFWNLHENSIKNWYKEQQQWDDVVISASPKFLLQEICNRLKIRFLIATKIDKKTGLLTGKNCFGKEKVKRFYQVFPDGRIKNFYSDSYSDLPLARVADFSYVVKKNEIVPWDTDSEFSQ